MSHRKATQPLRILLVEDHGDTRAVFAMLLGRKGHEVITVGSLAAALEAAHEHPEIDLLICDIGLPDGDGWELMTTLHSQLGVPGIAITARGLPSDLERSAAAGFAFHLSKPMDPQELFQAIDKISRMR